MFWQRIPKFSVSPGMESSKRRFYSFSCAAFLHTTLQNLDVNTDSSSCFFTHHSFFVFLFLPTWCVQKVSKICTNQRLSKVKKFVRQGRAVFERGSTCSSRCYNLSLLRPSPKMRHYVTNQWLSKVKREGKQRSAVCERGSTCFCCCSCFRWSWRVWHRWCYDHWAVWRDDKVGVDDRVSTQAKVGGKGGADAAQVPDTRRYKDKFFKLYTFTNAILLVLTEN